ncbi:MAG: hypothetical protein OEW48_13745 [Phycisphaerae bacterium]|nr:hypothetical protein [Phycisphaerae bacterium]
MIYLWPIAAIGLVLSIVTLFIERNIYYRALPWAVILFGILLYVVCCASRSMRWESSKSNVPEGILSRINVDS